jgi:hypothetical protein
MRERLTKRAADSVADKGTGIMNDPYQVNNPEHEKNDPKIDQYTGGGPSAWGEDVNKDLPGGPKDNKLRDPDTHIPEMSTKMAAEAIQAARKLEEKAVKCIVASQRILPGAEDTVIENQAADLMHLPDNMVDSLLSRQEELANTIAKAAACTAEKTEEKEEGKDKAEEKDAAKEEKKEDEKKDEKAEEKDAGKMPPAALEALKKSQGKKDDKDEKKEPEEKKEEKDEKKEEKAEEKDAKKDDKEEKKEEEKKDDKAEEKDAAKDDKEEKKEDEKKDEKAEEKDAGKGEVEASTNLLDDIFSGVIASDTKKGAKSLSGLVKKEASESNSDPLNGVWRTDPDVSQYFQ